VIPIEDWAAIKQRWQGWWQGEMYDRPLLCLRAPRNGAGPAQGLDVDPLTQWTDSAYFIHRAEEELRCMCLLGEALPSCWDPISAGHALYFGCQPHFEADTLWVEPAPTGPDGYPLLSGWRESAWWRLACAMTSSFARASRGRFFVFPFWGNHEGDTLALVRGIEQFLLDFVPEASGAYSPWLVWAIREMAAIHVEIHADLCRRAWAPEVGMEGTLNNLGPWSPTTTLPFDCDISCNISPRAFRELFVPPMVEAMQAVEHRIYHLDGAGALHHLDTLLGIPELQAIQWVPGAGHEAVAQWLPLLGRMHRGGKSTVIYAQPGEVGLLLDAVRQGILQPGRLCLHVNCASESAARQLIADVTRQF
jgi:hypothetical protein